MSIRMRVLGGPNGDNGLYVEIDTGQSVERILFDCGEGVPTSISYADLISLNHLGLSHCHMDHVAGFPTFFRRLYHNDRQTPVIWGPGGTANRLQHQMQGYLWNLVAHSPGAFRLIDVLSEEVHTMEARLDEGYAILRHLLTEPRFDVLFSGLGYDVIAVEMDHGAPSLAYIVRERAKLNVDTVKMAELGLRPGPWMKDLKGDGAGDALLDVNGMATSLAALRDALLVSTPGSSVAYCTDFLPDDAGMERLVPALRGVDVLVCESQYRHEDLALAVANKHLTSVQAATLAKAAGVGELQLIHVSDRYDAEGRRLLLADAQAVFPATRYPDGWN